MSWKGSRPSSVCYTKEQFSAFNAMKRTEYAAKKARAARLARRDAEYAASGVEVTVEERDLRNSELGRIMRIERLGFCPIAPRITHIGHD